MSRKDQKGVPDPSGPVNDRYCLQGVTRGRMKRMFGEEENMRLSISILSRVIRPGGFMRKISGQRKSARTFR